MPKMRAIQVPRAKGPFEIVEREIPEPSPGTVRIKVEACGVCHSDSIVKEGLFPWIEYPRIPGHEAIGVIDAVGTGVKEFKEGRVPAWDGTAATADSATPAGGGISSRVRHPCRLPALRGMGDMRST